MDAWGHIGRGSRLEWVGQPRCPMISGVVVHRLLFFNTGMEARRTENPLYKLQALSEQVIGLAIEVHRTIRLGLLESAYAACLCLELEQAGIPFVREASIPII